MKDIEQRARELEAKVWAAGSVEERRRVLEEHLRSAEPRSTAEAPRAALDRKMARTLALLLGIDEDTGDVCDATEWSNWPKRLTEDERMELAKVWITEDTLTPSREWLEGENMGLRTALNEAVRERDEALFRIQTMGSSDAPPVECSICLERGSPRDPVCPGCIQIACDALKTARSPNAPPGPYVHVPQAEYDELRLTLAAQATELHELRSRPDAMPHVGSGETCTCGATQTGRAYHDEPCARARRSDKATTGDAYELIQRRCVDFARHTGIESGKVPAIIDLVRTMMLETGTLRRSSETATPEELLVQFGRHMMERGDERRFVVIDNDNVVEVHRRTTRSCSQCYGTVGASGPVELCRFHYNEIAKGRERAKACESSSGSENTESSSPADASSRSEGRTHSSASADVSSPVEHRTGEAGGGT